MGRMRSPPTVGRIFYPLSPLDGGGGVEGLGSPFKVPFTRSIERTGSDDGVPFRLGFPSLRTLSHDTTPNEGSGREQMGVNRRTTTSPFSLLGGGEGGGVSPTVHLVHP